MRGGGSLLAVLTLGSTAPDVPVFLLCDLLIPSRVADRSLPSPWSVSLQPFEFRNPPYAVSQESGHPSVGFSGVGFGSDARLAGALQGVLGDSGSRAFFRAVPGQDPGLARGQDRRKRTEPPSRRGHRSTSGRLPEKAWQAGMDR